MANGSLVVCATPIGNLGDVSDRLRQTLLAAEVVYAEDTRRTQKLLNHLGANPRIRSYFVGNEKRRSSELLADLESGAKVALVSDAGMPTISDPGADVIDQARRAGHHVTVVPGPSAVTAAVALSGFGGDRFTFDGFLPKKGQERENRIASILGESRTVVLFASPHRLGTDLADLQTVLGDQRRVAVVRELTKLHEETWIGSLAEAVARWGKEIKGEVTLVIEGALPEPPDFAAVLSEARHLVGSGVSVSEAARTVARATGVSRSRIYAELLDTQD